MRWEDVAVQLVQTIDTSLETIMSSTCLIEWIPSWWIDSWFFPKNNQYVSWFARKTPQIFLKFSCLTSVFLRHQGSPELHSRSSSDSGSSQSKLNDGAIKRSALRRAKVGRSWASFARWTGNLSGDFRENDHRLGRQRRKHNKSVGATSAYCGHIVG